MSIINNFRLIGILFLFLCENATGQTYHVLQKGFETHYSRAIILSPTEICFPGFHREKKRPVIDFMSTNDNKIISKIIGEELNYDELEYRIIKKEADTYYVVSQGNRGDSSFVVITRINKKEQKVLSERFIGKSYEYYGLSRYFDTSKYRGIIISAGELYKIEEFIFLKLSNENQISLTSIKKEETQSKLFEIPVIGDVKVIKDNRLLFRSRHTNQIGIMDTLLNVIDFRTVINGKNYMGGSFYESSDGTFYQAVLLIANGFNWALTSIVEISDRLIFDVPIIFDKKKEDWYASPRICGKNKTIFCGFDKNRIVGSPHIPNLLSVSRFEENNLVWTKDYGGDYNLSITSMLLLKDKIYVSGKIHNYFGNDEDQGFYFVLDMDGEILTSSIDISESSEVKIYPNPSNGSIILDSDYKKNGLFKLYNLLGQEVFSINTSIAKSRIELPKLLQRGSYFYQILDLDGGILDGGKLILE